MPDGLGVNAIAAVEIMRDGFVWTFGAEEIIFAVPLAYISIVSSCPYELRRIPFDDIDRVWFRRGRPKQGYQLLLDAQQED